MSRLNDPENFVGRVNYAAQVIANRRPTSRAFDNCFENSDGDAVAAALMRRADKNPKLAANLPRYIDEAMARAAYAELAGKKLPEEARRMREEARARFAGDMARWKDEDKARAAGWEQGGDGPIWWHTSHGSWKNAASWGRTYATAREVIESEDYPEYQGAEEGDNDA